jgi:hypothetical protein
MSEAAIQKKVVDGITFRPCSPVNDGSIRIPDGSWISIDGRPVIVLPPADNPQDQKDFGGWVVYDPLCSEAGRELLESLGDDSEERAFANAVRLIRQ